jgi:phosphatidylserine/phosphatidylglycerophosphate/cardiolipin synthase-like enzyme
VFELLDACVKNPKLTLDVFAYDIDEPDIVHRLEQLGDRLRIFMDDAPLHTSKTALEPEVKKRLEHSAGKNNVKTGHFSRFSHDKIMIVSDDGKPVRVLTGSANFSVRGLYVQANSVLIFNDSDTAQTYSDVFNAVWQNKATAAFEKNELSQKWTDRTAKKGLPPFEVCFSPHHDPNLSLKRVSDAINQAQSSVLFAVMQLGGGGSVMDQLKKQTAKNKKLFWYGVTQNVAQPRGGKEKTTGITLHRSGGQRTLVPFAFLHKNVPQPFKAEINGGAGQVIHDKFVVTDFNGPNPVVFCGSSNLATGGEKSNGDNLIAIYDRAIATMFGVEAIRLVDHFGFRAALHKASDSLVLEGKNAKRPWWRDYYDPKNTRYFERLLFVK